MKDQFVSEPITPLADTFDLDAMSRGEPGLPGRFVWRGDQYTVVEVLERWKESGPAREGGRELYLRRHWYRVRTDGGLVMKIYFDRQARSGRQAKMACFISVAD